MRVTVNSEDPVMFALICTRNILGKLTPVQRKMVLDFLNQEQQTRYEMQPPRSEKERAL